MRLHPKRTIARIIMNSRFQRTPSTRTTIRTFRISTTPSEPPDRSQQASTRIRSFSLRQLLTLHRYLRMTTNVNCQSSASKHQSTVEPRSPTHPAWIRLRLAISVIRLSLRGRLCQQISRSVIQKNTQFPALQLLKTMSSSKWWAWAMPASWINQSTTGRPRLLSLRQRAPSDPSPTRSSRGPP